MSTYKAITLHPMTGLPEVATWHDDYYGKHKYAVEFLSDGKIFPAENCKQVQIDGVKTPDESVKLIHNLTEQEQEKIIGYILFKLGQEINQDDNLI